MAYGGQVAPTTVGAGSAVSLGGSAGDQRSSGNNLRIAENGITVGVDGSKLGHLKVWVISNPVSPSSLGANTTAGQHYTVTGLNQTHKVIACFPSTGVSQGVNTGLALVQAYCSDTDELTIVWGNFTGGALTPDQFAQITIVTITVPDIAVA